jgi:hypothetical protein
MRLPVAHPTLLQSRPPPAASDSRLAGRWLVGLRVGWVAIVLFDLAVFLASIPLAYAHLRGICPPVPLHECSAAPTPGNLLALHRLGLSLDLYALGSLLLGLVVAVLFMVLGAVIFWRKSAERLGLFVSLWLILFGASMIANSETGALVLAQTPQVVQLVFHYLENAIWPGLILFVCIFPDGRFIPRWAWLWVILALVISELPADSPFNPPNLPLPLFVAAEALVLGSPLGFQLYRYVRVSDAVGRQQTKWFVFGVAITLLSALTLQSLRGVLPLDSPYRLLGSALGSLVFVPIPLAIGIAILRHRLFDIDFIINRALVYGALTTMLLAIYAACILGAQAVLGVLARDAGAGSHQPVITVGTTLLVVALFRPLRARVQRVVDQRFYRQKYDAQKTLAAFGTTLRSEVDLSQLTEHLLATVQTTMQPTQVSLWLRQLEQHPIEQPYRQEPHRQVATNPDSD